MPAAGANHKPKRIEAPDNGGYPNVSPKVYVYAPEGNDLKMHLERINGFNTRAESPTKWQTDVYTGSDFFEKMLKDKAGNVVVLAGNNARKTEYILKSVEAGFNVLADKPMAITPEGFELLKKAFAVAQKKGVLLYDIMTERYGTRYQDMMIDFFERAQQKV